VSRKLLVRQRDRKTCAMTSLLIMLTLPEEGQNKYYSHLKARFPEVNINMSIITARSAPYRSADILITFGAHMSTTC